MDALFHQAYHMAMNGETPDGRKAEAVARAAAEHPRELAELAHEVRLVRFGERLELCGIVNARSGLCPENCAFCAQSARHRTGAPEYGFIGAEAVAEAAAKARDAGVFRFGVVISGASPGERDFEEILRAVRLVAELGMEPDVSLGLLDRERLARLKEAGLKRVHHNLETAHSFFPSVCTSHDYEDDVSLVRAARDMGLGVCCGGLFGLGETWGHRLELARTLAELGVESVPVNFLSPIPGTPLADQPVLSVDEAVGIVAMLRLLLPRAHLRLCGGRERIFGSDHGRMLTCGADGCMAGDYLTTPGTPVVEIIRAARGLGLEPR
ncbi:biotin synthase BioB [Desulfohalovibrio reitneri]|uniref:biotin synthase BioB n=1 Tax=Desulfohalovibrio reitneri TaxID=1307759 RepID=UPI00054DCDEA|nr:biotin synthase BioB [Desulfohalovibrio reitneri]